MKRKLFFFLGALCALGFYSCQKNAKDASPAQSEKWMSFPTEPRQRPIAAARTPHRPPERLAATVSHGTGKGDAGRGLSKAALPTGRFLIALGQLRSPFLLPNAR